MKKRIVLIVVAVLMLLGSTIAFADGGFYYGSFNTGFTSGQSFHKVNDKTIEDNNVSCKVGSYTGSVDSSYLSILKVGSTYVHCKTVDSGDNHVFTCDNTGTFRVRVENQSSGTLYIRGEMYIYNGATTRTITDYSHHW